MATISPIISIKSLHALPSTKNQLFSRRFTQHGVTNRPASKLVWQAAKLPAGTLQVEMPNQEPNFVPPSVGFTTTAEIWNSRACMIGLVVTFFTELIFHKGVLQMIGVEVGKGLDLPL